MISCRAAAATDPGRRRTENQDDFLIVALTDGDGDIVLRPRVGAAEVRAAVELDLDRSIALLVVADGMGGAAAGEIASAMAVEVVLGELREKWIGSESYDAEAFVFAIKNATKAANQQIHTFAASHSEYRGMGTTATVAGLLGDTIYVAQVGDSRAYLIRDGVARQITKDQSLMQKLIEAGELTEEEAAQSERRNIILQALGPEPMIKIDLTHQQVRRGDMLVLCSDGLSGQVSKDEIARIVTAAPDLVAACKQLIDRANENGGPDNITVIAARFDGSRLNPAGGIEEVGHRVFPLPETGQTAAVQAEVVMPDAEPHRASPSASLVAAGDAAAMDGVFGGPAGSLGGDSVNGSYDFSTAPTPVSGSPIVSPTRRQAGTLIAVALLVALVATAVWFVVRTAQRVSPAADTGHSSPTQQQPSAPPTPRG